MPPKKYSFSEEIASSQENFLNAHKADKELSAGGEIINGCSVGLNRIINHLAEQVPNSDKDPYTVFLVNLETLIRNNYANDKQTSIWIGDVSKDIQMLNQYIYEYSLSYAKHLPLKINIIYHLNIYDRIPEPYMSKTKSKSILGVRDMKIEYATNVMSGEEHYTSDHVDIFVNMFKGPIFDGPKSLAKYISKKNGASRLKDKILMLDNIPANFHLCRYIEDIDIIESYTANKKRLKNIGEKLYKEAHMPFSQYIHLALGDGIYFEKLITNSKIKKQLLNRVRNEKWNLFSEQQILAALAEYVPHELLTKYRFY